MAFGSDGSSEDMIYASLLMARENVAWVLSKKVEEGAFSMDCARQAARQLMHGNACRVFRLKEAGVPIET